MRIQVRILDIRLQYENTGKDIRYKNTVWEYR